MILLAADRVMWETYAAMPATASTAAALERRMARSMLRAEVAR